MKIEYTVLHLCTYLVMIGHVCSCMIRHSQIWSNKIQYSQLFLIIFESIKSDHTLSNKIWSIHTWNFFPREVHNLYNRNNEYSFDCKSAYIDCVCSSEFYLLKTHVPAWPHVHVSCIYQNSSFLIFLSQTLRLPYIFSVTAFFKLP